MTAIPSATCTDSVAGPYREANAPLIEEDKPRTDLTLKSLYTAAALRRIDRVRFAIPLFAALAMITLAACGDSDDETAAPVPLAQRFLTAEDAPGSKPDPVEKRETTTDFDTFISALSESSIDPDRDEMTTLFKDAGFKSAGMDARWYGETHSSENSAHVFSSFIELGLRRWSDECPRLARDGLR